MKPEKKYSIEEFQFFFNNRSYLTKERFFANLKAKFGWDHELISNMWKTFNNFPKDIHNNSKIDNVSFILEICLPIIRDLVAASEKNHIYRYDTFFSDFEKSNLRLFYIENRTESEDNGKVLHLDFNFLDALSMLPYSDLLKSGIKLIGISKFYEKFNLKHNSQETLQVYEGDYFSTNDDYWRDKRSNIFVILDGKVKRLNYIMGKGYLQSNNELNIDEDHDYNSYAITGCENWQHVGNIYESTAFLKD